MKFTKLTSTLLFGTMVAAALAAPVTAYAATEEGSGSANDGDSLPQTDNTKAGISFGQSGDNGNTGYLRLAQVPSVLDFGNHTSFDPDAKDFTADGKDSSHMFAHENYKTTKDSDAQKTNATTPLSTSNEDLANVNGKVPVIVVDKQALHDDAEEPNTNESGSWTLSVKSNGSLAQVDQDSNPVGDKKISDAQLVLNNTAYARTTNDIASLTGSDMDNDFTIPDGATDTNVGSINSGETVIDLDDTATDHQIAEAGDTEGLGANVFAWDKKDITLKLDPDSVIDSGIYESNLTWTLSAGITAGGGDQSEDGGDTGEGA